MKIYGVANGANEKENNEFMKRKARGNIFRKIYTRMYICMSVCQLRKINLLTLVLKKV